MNYKKLLRKFRGNNEYLILSIMFMLLTVLFVKSVFVDAAGDWYSTNWNYRKLVTINASQVLADQIDFPVLVDLTHVDFKNMWLGGHMGQIDAGDVLFTAADGITKLSHEIEFYDYATGDISAWVKIPSVSSLVNTEIYMYYGNENVADQWDSTGAVWTDNYLAVQHFSDNCTATDCYKDSTDPSAGNHGTPLDGDTIADLDVLDAKIGRGLDFDGNVNYLEIPDSAELDLSDDFTLETWVQLGELNRYNAIFDKGAYSLKISPDKEYIFSGKKDDTGAAWSVAKDFSLTDSATSFAVFNDELYVTLQNDDVANSYIYKTSDGVNFTEVKNWNGGGVTGGLTVFKGEMYVYYDNTIYQTSNGSSYSLVYTASDNISVMTVFNNYIYAGASTGGKLFRSLAGSSWSVVNTFLVSDLEEIMSLAVYDGSLFVGGEKGKIFASSSGTSFSLDHDFGSGLKVMALNSFDKKLWTVISSGVGATTYYRNDLGAWTESALP